MVIWLLNHLQEVDWVTYQVSSALVARKVLMLAEEQRPNKIKAKAKWDRSYAFDTGRSIFEHSAFKCELEGITISGILSMEQHWSKCIENSLSLPVSMYIDFFLSLSKAES